MTISSLKDYVDAIDSGQTILSSVRKVPAIATTAGAWCDLSMAPGNPKANYYTGAELSRTLFNSNLGIYHGASTGPLKKYLKTWTLMSTSATAVNSMFYLLDYIAFYPLIDMDSTDEQLLDNSVAMPRFSDGLGVKAMLVATNPYVGGANFSIKYTNQDGTSDQISQTVRSNTGTNISTLISGGTAVANAFGPFIPLASGDNGIRSVESITFTASNGGLATLVLVKPIAQTMLREITAPTEFESIRDKTKLPFISDDAYLNMICLPSGSLAANPIISLFEFIWG